MEWTKIKTKHFLFSKLTKSQKGDLADLLCLTAHLEKMPDESQMLQVCRKDALKVLRNYFKSESTLLQDVLKKVLEDVAKVKRSKIISCETSNRYRNTNKKSDTSHHKSHDTTEKIREDKIREDSYISKGSHVKISPASLGGLTTQYGKTTINLYIDKINDYLDATGKKPYKDYAAVIRQWMRKDNIKPKPKVFKVTPETEMTADMIYKGGEIKELITGIGE